MSNLKRSRYMHRGTSKVSEQSIVILESIFEKKWPKITQLQSIYEITQSFDQTLENEMLVF